MARIRVVTDSACDLPRRDRARLNIDIVSLTIRFGDEEFTDRVDLSPRSSGRSAKRSKTLPETAAPSPGAFQAAYERAKADGCDGVIVLTVVGAALGDPSVRGARRRGGGRARLHVRVVDTLKRSRWRQGLLVIDVAEAGQRPAPTSTNSSRTPSRLVTKVGVVAMLDTLEHLIKGGRVGGAKALLGQVLSIKPLH